MAREIFEERSGRRMWKEGGTRVNRRGDISAASLGANPGSESLFKAWLALNC